MEKDIIEYQINNVKYGDNNDERFETKIEHHNQSPNNNSVNSESALENNNSSNNNNSDVVNSPNTNNVTTSNQINNRPLFGNRNNLTKNGISNNIDNVGSKALQKMGVPKGISDKAIKKNGGTFSPTNLPGNKIVSKFARNKLDKMMSSKNNKDGLAERLGSSMGKRALSAINPALGAASEMMPKKNGEADTPSSDNKNSTNDNLNNGPSLVDVAASATGMSLKTKVLIGALASLPMLFLFLGVITVSVTIISKIGGVKLSDDVSATDTSISDKLQNDAHKSTEDGFDADIESAYIDIYDDNYINTINVKLVSKNNDLDFDNMSGLFGSNTECDPDSGNCIEGADKRFFLKMYDLYYLYLTKYNVKLDLTLIMATLTYNSNDLPETFTKNLSFYNRKLLVESDWNPTEMVGLEWDYDYQSLYKSFNYKHYIFANDSAFDMQLLAKNMVSKTTEQSCVKTNEEDNSKVTTKSKKIKDNEDDLVCDDGEELVKGNSTYTLDMDKYDNFLLEYIEKKSYYKVNSIIPYYFTGFDEVYQTDKVPSVINRIKKKSTSSSSRTSTESNSEIINESNSEIINKLNDLALGEVGKGGSNYWTSGADEWCAMFVSWLFEKVTSDKQYLVPAAGAGDIPRNSVPKGYGIWLEDECSDPSTVPQAGDVILFTPTIYPSDQYTSRHVGYVYQVDDNKVYTVEGNTGTNDCTTSYVAKREYDRKDCTINGYYRPNY